MVIIPSLDLGGKFSLKSARRLYGKTVYVDNLKIGGVFDVIGRVDAPYLVVRRLKNISVDDIIGRISYVSL